MHQLAVDLEGLYNGKTSKIKVNRDRICTKCNGKGGKDGAVQKCSGCKGRGQVTKMTMIGPGMYSQSQGACDECRGQGEIINQKDKCKECNAKKVVQDQKLISVEISKGAPNGERYIFHGEADEFPGTEAGDVVI